MAKLLSIARSRGEAIYIAGEPEEIVRADQLRNALEAFARRHRISMPFATEFLGDRILELIQLKGEVMPMVLSTLAKKLEPEVEGQVSSGLLRQWKEFERDLRRVQGVMQLEPDLELSVECWLNQWNWFEYWEINHWETAKRREFSSALCQLEPTRQRLLERVNEYKRRRAS